MDTSLHTLVMAAGAAIQEAQKELERNTVSLYYREFEPRTSENGGPDVMAPVMRQIGVPTADGGISILHVPLTALFHHNNLNLEQVSIKLNASLEMEQDQLMAKVGSLSPDGEDGTQQSQSVIELLFKRNDPPEGIARQNQEFLKLL